MKCLYLVALLIASLFFGQTITFKACHNLFDNQEYVFNRIEADAHGKGIYITEPVNNDQPCGGIGNCLFKIVWNESLTRWDFLADNGDGDFIEPFLIYYNSTGNNLAINPPSNSVGTWEENISVTESLCGGNLTSLNSTMTGDVHTTVLSINDFDKTKAIIFPNPVKEKLQLLGFDNGKSIQIYNMNGQLVQDVKFSPSINVSNLKIGVYILRVILNNGERYETKLVKE